jgi:hypothetical protein
MLDLALPIAGVDDLYRATGKGLFALERQLGVGAERRRQTHAVCEQDGQHDQAELVERSQGAIGLDRARAADEVDVPLRGPLPGASPEDAPGQRRGRRAPFRNGSSKRCTPL